MTMYGIGIYNVLRCVLVDIYYNLQLENGGVENGTSESKCGNVETLCKYTL